MSKELYQHLLRITQNYNCDIYVFSAEINYVNVDAFIDRLVDPQNRKKNCYLFLTTNGGDPDAGYRLARIIKRSYEQFIICVLGLCKSTGTLIALGADKIIMGNYGEFGPLDIQLLKDDELSRTSGLSYLQSLTSLYDQAFSSFESTFMNLKHKSNHSITTRTAAEIASKMSIGIIAPISAQIDPVKLGEVQRAMNIALAYGRKLCKNENLVNQLVLGYPSHSFVLDYEESALLFGETIVSFATEDELYVEKILPHIIRAQANRIEHIPISEVDGEAVAQDEDIAENTNNDKNNSIPDNKQSKTRKK